MNSTLELLKLKQKTWTVLEKCKKKKKKLNSIKKKKKKKKDIRPCDLH
jgi:hypothetical protein